MWWETNIKMRWKVSNVMRRSLDSSGHILNRAMCDRSYWRTMLAIQLECGLEKSRISNGMRGNQNERLFGKERDRYVL